jgi:hypothetical protein
MWSRTRGEGPAQAPPPPPPRPVAVLALGIPIEDVIGRPVPPISACRVGEGAGD